MVIWSAESAAGCGQALVVGANAVRVGYRQGGRCGAGEVEALQFGAFEDAEGFVNEGAETLLVAEVVAACFLGGDTERNLAVAVLKQPLVHFLTRLFDGVVNGGGVWREDEEFARRVLNLRGRRQGAGFKQFQCRHFGE